MIRTAMGDAVSYKTNPVAIIERVRLTLNPLGMDVLGT
jgi:hypothetical protein